MPKYRVEVPEIHILTVEVEANNASLAKDIVEEMITKKRLNEYNSSIRYDHTLPANEWKVTEQSTKVKVDILFNDGSWRTEDIEVGKDYEDVRDEEEEYAYLNPLIEKKYPNLSKFLIY